MSIKMKHRFLLIIVLATLSGANQPGMPKAWAANENDLQGSATISAPFVPISTVQPVLVLNSHTGSKYPSYINMVVCQKLAFKGNNALDLMTLRYHEITLGSSPTGPDPLKEVGKSGYKDAFLAVAPGETTLDIGSNTLFYGLLPWRSHLVKVRVFPAESVPAIAAKPAQILQ